MQEIVKRLKESKQIKLAREILESHGYTVTKKVDEGIFGIKSKAEKKKEYEEAIYDVFNKRTSAIVTEVYTAAEEIIRDTADEGVDRNVVVRQIESSMMNAINNIKKDPAGVVSTLIRLGRKYAQESRGLETIEEIMTKVRELQKVENVGYDAKEYLLAQIGEQVGQKLKTSLSKLKQDARYDK